MAEFADEGVSGAKGRDKRPAFDRLMKAVTRREVDMMAAWSASRVSAHTLSASQPYCGSTRWTAMRASWHRSLAVIVGSVGREGPEWRMGGAPGRRDGAAHDHAAGCGRTSIWRVGQTCDKVIRF